MPQKLSDPAQKISDFLTRSAKSLLARRGLEVGIADFAVLQAAKKITAHECHPILVEAARKVLSENPEIVPLVIDGLGESVKEKIRQALAK